MDSDNFGYALRDARLKAGRTVDDIARRTKIPAPTLERLEQGDRAALPADVFVCGFLRAYAREVGLNADEAVARYRVSAPTSHPVDAQIVVVDAEAEIVRPAVEAPTTTPPTVNSRVAGWSARLQMLLDGSSPVAGQSRGPTFALVVLLVVLVATITLSLLLGGDPRPGRGLS